MINQKRFKIILLSILLLVFIFPLVTAMAAPNLKYEPMETLPGFAKTDDFAVFISNIYKFGIWTVGICALIMIVIGGYMYAASGGNNASMEKAKSFITDAIIGLIIALLAYLIVYIINPELVKITLKSTGTTGVTTAPPISQPTLVECTGTSGKAPLNSHLCSVDFPLTPTPVKLVTTCLPNEPCTYQCNEGYKAEGLKCVPIGAAVSTSLAQAATALSANNRVAFASTGDCKDASGSPVTPISSLAAAKNGTSSTICNASCKGTGGTPCTGNVLMKKELFDTINTVGKETPLTVSSFTGGQHKTDSSHYSGKAADIVPKTTKKSEWSGIVNQFKNNGCSAFCDLRGDEDKYCTVGDHIHISC